jgi:membrane-bound metal-dependent hydrolase YbcI (DUF457 family)
MKITDLNWSVSLVKMPNFKAHTTVGLIVSIVFTFIMIKFDPNYLADYERLIINVIGITLFSMVPDIDQPGSYPKQLLLVFVALSVGILALLKLYIFIILICVLLLILSFTKHRGFMHSYLFGIMISGPFLVYNWQLAIAGFISFCSHLWLDKIFIKRRPYNG